MHISVESTSSLVFLLMVSLLAGKWVLLSRENLKGGKKGGIVDSYRYLQLTIISVVS